MTKKLVWRLGKLPSPDEVRELVKDKIITQEEARDILFSDKEDTERDTKSLEEEIKFLRTLVEKLSVGSTKIVEVIKEVYRPYYTQPWYQPYGYWVTCQNISSTGTTTGSNAYTLTGTSSNQLNALNTQVGSNMASGQAQTSFSSIKTF